MRGNERGAGNVLVRLVSEKGANATDCIHRIIIVGGAVEAARVAHCLLVAIPHAVEDQQVLAPLSARAKFPRAVKDAAFEGDLLFQGRRLKQEGWGRTIGDQAGATRSRPVNRRNPRSKLTRLCFPAIAKAAR